MNSDIEKAFSDLEDCATEFFNVGSNGHAADVKNAIQAFRAALPAPMPAPTQPPPASTQARSEGETIETREELDGIERELIDASADSSADDQIKRLTTTIRVLKGWAE